MVKKGKVATGTNRGKNFDLKASCREFAPEVVEKLKAIISKPGAIRQVKMMAMREILDRAYGKAKETVESVGGPRIIEIVRRRGKDVESITVSQPGELPEPEEEKSGDD